MPVKPNWLSPQSQLGDSGLILSISILPSLLPPLVLLLIFVLLLSLGWGI